MNTREATIKPLSAKAEKLQRQQDAIERLKRLVQEGDAIHVLRTSNTNTGRRARVFIARGRNEISDITASYGLALGKRLHDTGRWEVFMGGHGYSLSGEIADDLSHLLFNRSKALLEVSL